MDRTNWRFGKSYINVFVIGIVHEGDVFPILFQMMDKFGNSNTKEHVKILDKYNSLFGFGSIEVVVSEREFVGDDWLKYLNMNKIPY
jgi:hypothetical protein